MPIRTLRKLFWIVLIIVALTAISGAQRAQPLSPHTVVFICEHGAARSVIAAAYFNKLASERDLPLHAVARGVTPQSELSVATVDGLRKDGIPLPSDRPRAYTTAELKQAERVVTFYPLPRVPRKLRIESFEVPAPGDGYERSRDAILMHVRTLIDELTTKLQYSRPR